MQENGPQQQIVQTLKTKNLNILFINILKI